MKKILRVLTGRLLWCSPFFFSVLGAGQAQAQVSAYMFAASSGTYTPLPATATAVPSILGDDIISAVLPIGFSFEFDGTTYTQVKASSNGFLSFNPAAGSNLSNNLSTIAVTEKPMVAPLWDDLDGRPTGATAVASYTTTGTAPNRVFTFEWSNWEWYYTASAAIISFQAKLYEGTNKVEFVYHPIALAPTAGASASIGIAGGSAVGCASAYLSLSGTTPTATASSTVETRSINTLPAEGQTFAFLPPPPTMGQCAQVRCANVTNVTGIAAQINFNGNASATSYTVTYQATGGTLQTVTPAPTASPVNLTGLTMNTTYTVTVTANCASGSSTPVTLTFTTSNGYCVTGSGTTVLGGSCGGNNVTDVSIIGTTFAATGLTCASPIAGTAYTNYPATAPLAGTLFKGETYPISVTTTGNSIISAWIDFNHDLDFSPTEWVQVATTTVAGTAAVNTITIPGTAANAYVGPTGFRVRSRASGNPNAAIDPCTHFYSGETKDFTINLAPEPPCPAPSALGATALTTSGATLNFTAPAGGGTYTLVYGPQGFNPATGGTTVSPATSPLAVTGLNSGTTYQFYVQRNCGAPGLSVNAGPFTFTTSIANDDPCGATTLTLGLTGCQPLGTTNIGATTTTPAGYTNPTTGCGIGANPKDVWFKFTTAATGPGSSSVRVTVTGTAASVVQALSATACAGPFTFIRCSGTGNGTVAPNLDLTTLLPGTTYYVRVFGYSPGSQPGNFSICVTPLPSCPAPTALTAANVTKNSATLTWAAGAGLPPASSTYTVIYGPPGFNPANSGTSLAGLTGTSTALTGLTSLTDYCFYVQLTCGGLNGNSPQVGPVCFQTLLETPANDDPCGATTFVPGGAAATGTTVGATTSIQNGINLPACSPAQSPRDVWYAVTMPTSPVGTVTLTLTLTGTAAGMVRLFTAPDCANGPFNQEFCQAATGANTGFAAPVVVPGLLPGRRYYVAMSGYSSSDAPASFSFTATTTLVTGTSAAQAGAALLVLPNPSATGSVSVRYAGTTGTEATLSLYNALGQLVLHDTAPLRSGLLDHSLRTQGLATGLYTLRVQLGTKVLSRKVVLE